MYRYFFKLLSFFFLVNVSYAEPLSSIEISGLESISRGTVLNFLPIEVGEDVSDFDHEEAIKSLEKTDFFSHIKVNLRGNKLTVVLKENPTLKYFDFSGFKEDEVLNEQLIEDIKSNFNLRKGKIFLKKNLDNLMQQIVNLYRSNGFYNAVISINSDIDEKNRIGIEILINEGNKALIRSFKISGNNYFENKELLDLFEIGEPDFFLINYFTEKDSFSYEKFNAGISFIKSKYLNDGFLDYKILKKEISFVKEENKLDISIIIDEGPRYKLSKLNFISEISDLDKEKFRDLIDIKNDSFYSQKKLSVGLSEIAKIFQDKGYIFTKINSRISKINDDNSIEVDILIDESIKAYINRIEISGNTRTQDDVIRRELKLLEGQVFSQKDLNKSIERIKRLGFFSDVNFDLAKDKNNSDSVTLNINVIESKTGEISIGLSHSNSSGASINAGITQNNILGTGNIFNATLSNSSAVKETSFYFKDPYFNNLGHSISYGLFDKNIDAENLDAASYSISETGFILGYGIPLSNVSNIFAETRLSSLDLKCGNDLKTLYEISDCSSNNDLDSKLNLTYSLDSLNDFFFPSNGSKNILSATVTLPISDYKYYQIESLHNHYSPIFDSKTLKLSSRIKLSSGFGGDSLPFFKRYFEGGSSSVRGFDFNSLGEKYLNGKPKGGELSIITSAGIASSLNFLGIDNQNMKGILFIDAGSLYPKLNDFDLSDIRSSTGVQFAWITPIGPLGFNFAKPIRKKSGDTTETFSFELGTKF